MEKTREERIAELLDGSAKDAVDQIKGPSLSDLTTPEEETAAPAPESEEEETPTGGKKVRIPASRLKTLTSELEELRGQVSSFQKSQERIAALENQINSKGEDDLPDWWKEAYGDNDISKQGYKNQQRIMREEMKRELAEREAQHEAEETERVERINAIEQTFDEQMDGLEETIGRELTDNQKAEIMDIVGEYSPAKNGKYEAYMDISKAYDIWQKGQGGNAAKQEMARIAGIQSSNSGNTQSSSERPQWGDWRKRF